MYNKKHTQNVLFARKKSYLALSSAILAASISAGVYAQDSAKADEKVLEEVLVTGTLIRGAEATGSNVLAVDSTEISQLGVTTTNEILGSLPQISNMFNGRTEGDPRGAAQDTINRPNLRSLPGWNAASGSVTLLLIDGNRMTPMGVEESAVDPDIIPAAILQRVDVVPDGGSSLYGADAVGGVINFVTKREFEGVQVDLNFTQGLTISEYDSQDYNITAGKSWDNGNGYVSIGHYDRAGLINNDTSWARQGFWEGNVLTDFGTECLKPVGTIMRYKWYSPFSVWTNNPAAGGGVFPIGDASPCNIYGESTLLAAQERDSFFGSLSQNLADGVDLRVTSYFTERTASHTNYPRGMTTQAQGAPTTPGTYFFETKDMDNGTGFSFGAHPDYEDMDMVIKIKTWGFNGELDYNLGNDWMLKATSHIGESDNSLRNPSVNRSLAQAAVNAGTLNPQDVASADSALISSILNYQGETDSKHSRKSVKLVADGPLFTMPAGDVKVAIGAEYGRDSTSFRSGVGTIGFISNEDFPSISRNTTSVFGELNVPLLENLDLALAARYDDYSDFGDTTNPSVGLTFSPNDVLTIKAKWGESFNAPTLIDSFGIPAIYSYTQAYAGGRVPSASDDPYGTWDGVSGPYVLHIAGVGGRLQPQTAENTAFTVELRPIEGMLLSGTYYEIDFQNILGSVNPLDPSTRVANPEKYIFSPTQDVVDSYLARVSNAAAYPNVKAEDITYLLDRIVSNLNSAKLAGYDFNLSYQHAYENGIMSYGVAGNRLTQNETVAGETVTNGLAKNTPTVYGSAHIAYYGEQLTLKWTTNFTGEHDSDNAFGGIQKIDTFMTHNLSASYNFGEDQGGFFDGLTLRVNLDNVTDTEPQILYQNASNLAFSGFSLGRVFKLGISKKF